jgi:hypothetical protein
MISNFIKKAPVCPLKLYGANKCLSFALGAEKYGVTPRWCCALFCFYLMYVILPLRDRRWRSSFWNSRTSTRIFIAGAANETSQAHLQTHIGSHDKKS